MEIYSKLYDVIGNLKLLKEQRELPNQLVEFTLLNISYPSELKTILFEYPDWSLKILSRYQQITLKSIEDGEPLEKLLQFVEKKLFNNNNKTDNEKIKTFILIDNQINKFLKEENYFQKCYDEQGISNVEITKYDVIESDDESDNKSDIESDIDSIDETTNYDDNLDVFDNIDELSLPNYKKHLHQIEAINKLIKTNFQSGLVCAIMGAGKSFIILNALQSHWDIYKKENKKINPIYLICTDRTEILRSLFMCNITTKIKNKYLKKNVDDANKINLNIFETSKFKKHYDEVIALHSIDNYVVSYQKEHYSWDLEKMAIWKKNNIFNFEDFDLVENIISKEFCVDKINKATKPVVLISNNDFLKTNEKYKLIDKSRLKIIFNDECHGISGNNNYKMLKYFRDNNVNIIGLSATPSREGKKAKSNLLSVYGTTPDDDKTNKLNIIINYDMIQALEDGVVLPFYHIVVKPTILNKKIILDTTNKEQVSLRTIVNQYIVNNDNLPYHKIIAWVKKISHIQDNGLYFSYIKDILENKFKIYRSYSGNDEAKQIDEFGKFELEDKNSLLLCVNRGKEGSDIKHLDMGLFLDAVKQRSITVSLQTFGRVMRPDKEGKKKVGYIVECIKIDENKSVEMMSVKKVLNYYKMILNLASLSDSTEYYDKIIKLFANTEFDDEAKEVVFNLGNIKSKLKLDVQITDWTKLKDFLSKEICQKLKLTKQQLFDKYLNIIKKQKGFDDPESNFHKLYLKLNHIELGLPKNIYNEFKEIWEKNTWYDVLGHKMYLNLNDLRNLIKTKYQHIITLDDKSYNQLQLKNNDKLPKYPLEYYKLDLIHTYQDLLKNDKK
jgi:superfamily II DNA or RNA helicase